MYIFIQSSSVKEKKLVFVNGMTIIHGVTFLTTWPASLNFNFIYQSYIPENAMKKVTVFILVSVCLILTGSAIGQTAADHLQRGDEYSARFERQEALKAYEAALQIDPGSYEALWKAARELSFIGNKMEKTAKKEDTEQTYARSVEYAEKALTQNADGVDANFYLAVAMGRLGLYKGKKEMISLSKDVKIHADKVVELDPTYYKVYYLIGRWHDKIANVNWVLRQFAKIIYGGLPDASNEQALANYKKAIELNPDYVECHKELGRFYLDRKEYKMAADVLERCVGLPESEENDAEFKAEARELLEKAQKKIK